MCLECVVNGMWKYRKNRTDNKKDQNDIQCQECNKLNLYNEPDLIINHRIKEITT